MNNLTHNQLKPLISKSKWIMKCGMVLIITIGIFSCKKNQNTKTDEYYVKYEVNSSTIYSGSTLKVEINNEENNILPFTINAKIPWEAIIGPVKKEFAASIKISEINSNSGKLTLSSKISVSKNGSPFAIKKNDDSNTPRTFLDLNYTIDY